MLKKITYTAAFLLTSSFVHASWIKPGSLQTFASHAYTERDAIRIAKYQAPKIHCTVNGPTPEDEYCVEGQSKVLAVTNPKTGQAWKYRVLRRVGHLNDSYVEVTKLNFTSTERELLQTLYKIDRDFRVGVKGYISNSGANSAYSFNRQRQAFSAGSGEDCSSHPISYFNSLREQMRVQDEMAKGIAEAIGDTDWYDAFEDTDITGATLSVSLGGASLGVTFNHTNTEAFAHKMYGSGDNILNFKVAYHGEYEIDGNRNLKLDFQLLEGSSRIDGINLKGLFSNDSNHVIDLTKEPVSSCLIKYISENSKVVDKNGRPTGGVINLTIPTSGTGGYGGGFCTRKVMTSACSSGGGCRYQVFAFPTSC